MTQTATTQKVRRYTAECMMCGQTKTADVPARSITENITDHATYHLQVTTSVEVYCRACDCLTEATSYTMEDA